MSPHDDSRVPDFFIAGAPKCGSTTLYALLNQHSEISMSEQKEPGFFSRDDIALDHTYPFFHFEEWKQFDWREEQYWQKYLQNFPDNDTLKGEATPGYLYSRTAAERIDSTIEEPKAIFILRDPLKRTYSAYWHNLRMGRTHLSFKQTLLQSYHRYLERSIYPPFLGLWEQILGPENIHLLLLEQLIEEPQEQANEIFRFLNVTEKDINLPEKNKGNIPRFPIFLQAFNLYSQLRGKDISHGPRRDTEYYSLPEKIYRKLFFLNPLMQASKKPSIDPQRREKLETILRRENEDILEYKPEARQYWSIFED